MTNKHFEFMEALAALLVLAWILSKPLDRLVETVSELIKTLFR